MPSSSICWGIEIGAGAIKAIKLEAGEDGSEKPPPPSAASAVR